MSYFDIVFDFMKRRNSTKGFRIPPDSLMANIGLIRPFIHAFTLCRPSFPLPFSFSLIFSKSFENKLEVYPFFSNISRCTFFSIVRTFSFLTIVE